MAKTTDREDVAGRIVAAAAKLLREGGEEALTTRTLERAAAVRSPTVYRHFGDKQGLLEAVADHELARYVDDKIRSAAAEDPDPVAALEAGWRDSVAFGLENPALFTLMQARPRSAGRWAAAERGQDLLRGRVERVARAGRLAVSVERATDLLVASSRGATIRLLDRPPGSRKSPLVEDVLAAVMSMIVLDRPSAHDASLPAAAGALRALLPEAGEALTAGEAALLDELLRRLAE